MVSEACWVYGWGVEQVLAMDTKRFFVMLEAGRKLKSAEYQTLCDIHAISIANDKYHAELRASFSQRWTDEKELAQVASQLEGEAARNALLGMFAG